MVECCTFDRQQYHRVTRTSVSANQICASRAARKAAGRPLLGLLAGRGFFLSHKFCNYHSLHPVGRSPTSERKPWPLGLNHSKNKACVADPARWAYIICVATVFGQRCNIRPKRCNISPVHLSTKATNKGVLAYKKARRASRVAPFCKMLHLHFLPLC